MCKIPFFKKHNLYDYRTKVLNNVFFNKSYLRTNLDLQKKTVLFDNYYNFFSSNTLIKTPSFLHSIGSASNSTQYTYKSIKNNKLRFKINVVHFTKYKNSTTFLYSFLKQLSLLYKNKLLSTPPRTDTTAKILEAHDTESPQKRLNPYKYTLILLKGIRGGYRCYSLGFFGFLPKSQFKKYILKICSIKRRHFSFFIAFFKNNCSISKNISVFKNIFPLYYNRIKAFVTKIELAKPSLKKETSKFYKNTFLKKRFIKIVFLYKHQYKKLKKH